ncbi:MAG: outer membrane protein transport protein, partial [Candidatus Aminicenantaceae bacterium]
MKRGRVVFSAVILLCFLSSMALANGLNLNSIGTRALAMGGAFVGLADDFSAIYWNPAGIAHFKQKHFGFYATDIIPSSTYKLEPGIPGIGTFRLVKADTVSKHYLSGLAAYYFPVSEKVVAGIGVYVPSGLGASWDGTDFAAIANNNPSLDWRSKIGLITISPALAFKINDNIFVGATLNINYGKFDIAMHGGATDAPLPVVDLGQYEESMTGWGYGATLGVLIKPTDKLSIGATFRTASTVKFEGDASLTGMSDLGLALGTSLNQTSNLNREVTWPMWFAAGVSFKPIEELTLTGDV